MYKTKKNFSLIFLLFILLIIFAHGCGINDLLDNKKNKQTDNNSFEIGPNGGTISIDGISISIPAGAFEQTANIKVTQSNNITEEDIVTPIYSVEGFPDNYSLPIDITIKLNDTTKNDTYLVVQDETFTTSLGTVGSGNVYFKSKINKGQLEGQIPSIYSSNINKTSSIYTLSNKNSTKSIFSIKIFGSSNKKNFITNNNHFNIIYDASIDNISEITNLGEYLETGYIKIKNIGFDYNRRTYWPVNVYVEKLKNNVYGFFKASHFGINSDYMRFNRLNLNKRLQLKVTAIHEFFHLAQSLYDPRSTFNKAGYPSPNLWFFEASSVWSEDLVSSAGYITSIKDNNTVKQPFLGLLADLDTPDNATFHGYGMSAFVKYLTTKYGSNILVKIYEKLFAGRHVIDAINNSINYNLFMEYTPFLEQYSQKQIYNDLEYDDLLAIREGFFRIQTDSDTVKTFSANYKELSAKLFLVRLDNQNFSQNTSLNLSVDKELCDISVFEYPKSGGDVTLLVKGQKNCVVSKLRSLVEQGKYLIVMVTNSNFISNNYKPSNLDINLTMKVKTTKKLSVEVSINIDGAVYKEKVNNENWITKQNETFIFNPSAGVNGPKVGTFNNNVFLSPLDDVYNPLHVESSYIKITFLENPKRINLECELIIDDKTAGIKKHRKFSITGIPEEDTGRYWEYGGDLSRASIIDTYERHDYSGDLISELVSINPGSNAKVEVKIK